MGNKPYNIYEFDIYLNFIKKAMDRGYEIRREGDEIIIENEKEKYIIKAKKGKEQLIEDLWQEYLRLKKND